MRLTNVNTRRLSGLKYKIGMLFQNGARHGWGWRQGVCIRVSVHLRQNSLKSSLGAQLVNEYGPESSLGAKSKPVSASTAIRSDNKWTYLLQPS